MKNNNTLKVVYSALFAALVFAGTEFIRIPLPFGYFNFGDCFVLLSAVIIGGPYAVAASAIGAGLADVLSGYTIYAPATIIIKSLMVIAMITVSKMGRGKRGALKFLFLIFGAVVSELIMVGGYFIYDIILYRFAGAVAALPGNLLQGTAGVIASILLVTAFEKSGLIKRIKPKQ